MNIFWGMQMYFNSWNIKSILLLMLQCNIGVLSLLMIIKFSHTIVPNYFTFLCLFVWFLNLYRKCLYFIKKKNLHSLSSKRLPKSFILLVRWFVKRSVESASFMCCQYALNRLFRCLLKHTKHFLENVAYEFLWILMRLHSYLDYTTNYLER